MSCMHAFHVIHNPSHSQATPSDVVLLTCPFHSRGGGYGGVGVGGAEITHFIAHVRKGDEIITRHSGTDVSKREEGWRG